MNIAIGEIESDTKMEKDDSFWFSDKLEDWYGLKPKIRRRIKPKHIVERVEIIKNKQEFYNSTQAAKYCGVSAATFLTRFRESGMSPKGIGAKKYSYDQVNRIALIYANGKPKNLQKRILEVKKEVKDMTFKAEDISIYTGYTIDHVKKFMNQETYTYSGMKSLEKKIRQCK